MAGRSVRPWPLRNASTLFLRIPRVDWPRVIIGEKTELRSAGRYALVPSRLNVPLPVLGYVIPEHAPPAARLLLLEEWDSELLGAISQESIEREGFTTRAEFKHYWRRYRTRKAFEPLARVWVYRFRPFTAEDVGPAGAHLFEHLYGDHAPR